MWPLIMNVLKRYVPIVTLPFAGIVGLIGYHLENYISNSSTPSTKSIVEQREERLLKSLDTNVHITNQHKPLEFNLPPSLSS